MPWKVSSGLLPPVPSVTWKVRTMSQISHQLTPIFACVTHIIYHWIALYALHKKRTVVSTMMRPLCLLFFVLISIFSSHATHFSPRGGAWFGRRGGNVGKKAVEPTTDKIPSKDSKTGSANVKNSPSPSKSKKQRKIKKKIRKHKEVRKHRKGSNTVPTAKAGKVNTENEQDRRKIRSEQSHRRKRVKGESTEGYDQSGDSSQPVRKLVRKTKKKNRHRTLTRRDEATLLVSQSMSVQDDDEIVAQVPLPKNHNKKIKKRTMRKKTVEGIRFDPDAVLEPHPNLSPEPTLRPRKRIKKRKIRAGTVRKASIPVALTSVEPDLPLKKHKKRRKRSTSKVKGVSEIDHTVTLDAGVEKVREDSSKLKKKRKKVKKRATLLEEATLEGDHARGTFEKPLGDRLMETIPLPTSSVPAHEAVDGSFEADDHKLEPDASEKIHGISNDSIDEIGAGAIGASRDESELAATETAETSVPFAGHHAKTDQSKDRGNVEDIDERDLAPREEVEEHDGHGMLGETSERAPVFEDGQDDIGQVKARADDLSVTKSLMPDDQDANKEPETEKEAARYESDGSEREPEGHAAADADSSADNDALDELVEALIEGKLDESGANGNVASIGFSESIEDALIEESVKTGSATSPSEELEENDLLNDKIPLRSDTILGEETHIRGATSIGGKENGEYLVSAIIEEDITRVESALSDFSRESPSDSIVDMEEQENADSDEQLALQEGLASELPSESTIAMEAPGGGDGGERADDLVAIGKRVDEGFEGNIVEVEQPDVEDRDFQRGSHNSFDSGDSNKSNNDEVDEDVEAAAEVDVVVDASDVESDLQLIDDPIGPNGAEVANDEEEVSKKYEAIEPDILASEKILLSGTIDDSAKLRDMERAKKVLAAGDEKEHAGLVNLETRLEGMGNPTEATLKLEDLELRSDTVLPAEKEDVTSDREGAQPTSDESTCAHHESNETLDRELDDGELRHQEDPACELGGSDVRDSASSNEAETTGTSTSEVSSNLPLNLKMHEAAKESVVPSGETSDNQTTVSQQKIVKTDIQSIAESEDDESDITVSVVSWNLAEQVIPENDAAFIRKFRSTPRCQQDGEDGSDIVLISSQECENIKPRRSEGHRSRELRRLMIKMLGKNYVPLAIHSLGGIQFGLFCKRSILSDIEFVSIADVTCGIGNVFHNKGAIGAFLQMKSRISSRSEGADVKMRTAKSVKMLFVTAHLAAHVKNVDSRNMDYWRIASELQAQAPARFLPTKQNTAPDDESNGSGSHLIDSVDRIFFCGDLNYRVDLPREITENSILTIKRLMRLGDAESLKKAEELRSDLLMHDQLRQVLAQGAAFPGFAEGRITFMPTFKFDMDTDDYDSSHKQRIPAWTDRVLFKPFGTRVIEYTSEENSRHSDHRPVHATFRVSTIGRDVATLPKRGSTKKRSRRSTGAKQNLPHV